MSSRILIQAKNRHQVHMMLLILAIWRRGLNYIIYSDNALKNNKLASYLWSQEDSSRAYALHATKNQAQLGLIFHVQYK